MEREGRGWCFREAAQTSSPRRQYFIGVWKEGNKPHRDLELMLPGKGHSRGQGESWLVEPEEQHRGSAAGAGQGAGRWGEDEGRLDRAPGPGQVGLCWPW